MNVAEAEFFSCLASGGFCVDPDGRIWRDKVRYGGARRPLLPVRRRRAESKDPKGYLVVRFMINGKSHTAFAHRLVWVHLSGRDIPKGVEVNHKNGVKSDNRPGNLELVTHSENMKHARTVLGIRSRGKPGESNPHAGLTYGQAEEIRRMWMSGGYSQRALSAMFGVVQSAISKVVNNRSYRQEASRG